MKELIVYYSLTGVNERAAFALKEILDCQIEKIIELRNRRGFFMFLKNGFDATTRRLTNIKEFAIDLGGFYKVILFTPIWAGHLPPATRTFLKKYGGEIKNLEVVSVSGFGSKNSDFIKDVEKVIGKNIPRFLFITQSNVKDGSYRRILEGFFSIR